MTAQRLATFGSAIAAGICGFLGGAIFAIYVREHSALWLDKTGTMAVATVFALLAAAGTAFLVEARYERAARRGRLALASASLFVLAVTLWLFFTTILH